MLKKTIVVMCAMFFICVLVFSWLQRVWCFYEEERGCICASYLIFSIFISHIKFLLIGAAFVILFLLLWVSGLVYAYLD